MSKTKDVGVIGRDHCHELFQEDILEEADWLRRTANHKADSIETFIKKHNIPCNTLLELGCGSGAVIMECQRRKLFKRLIGIDYSDVAIDFLRRNSEGIETMVADITAPSFSFNDKIDVVVLSHVVEHFEDPSTF